jgi:hypothetical protein
LNINLDINNEIQDCKIDTVCGGRVLAREGRVNERDYSEGIWLIDFIYEIKQRNLLQ